MKFTFGIITKSENNFGVDDPASTDKKNIVSAIESINNYNTQYEILHTSYQSSKYYLILTKFDGKFYKIFYQYMGGNHIQYSM